MLHWSPRYTGLPFVCKLHEDEARALFVEHRCLVATGISITISNIWEWRFVHTNWVCVLDGWMDGYTIFCGFSNYYLWVNLSFPNLKKELSWLNIRGLALYTAEPSPWLLLINWLFSFKIQSKIVELAVVRVQCSIHQFCRCWPLSGCFWFNRDTTVMCYLLLLLYFKTT